MFKRFFIIIALFFSNAFLCSQIDLPATISELQKDVDLIIQEPWCVLNRCVINGNVICVNVHKLEIIDSDISGNIEFQGIHGAVELLGESSFAGTIFNGDITKIGCINIHALNIKNSKIGGSIIFEGIVRALEANSP